MSRINKAGKIWHFVAANPLPSEVFAASPGKEALRPQKTRYVIVQPTSEEELRRGINAALEVGYRLFDTAYVYKNEHILGSVLKEWMEAGKLRRHEFFVITKLPAIGMEESRVEHFLKLSLASLKLEYVDLYLVHFPFGLPYNGNDSDIFPRASDGRFLVDSSTHLDSVWKGMEQEVDAGRAKTIGISNFNLKQVKGILTSARIPPAATQIETHVFCQQQEMRRFCTEQKISVIAYAPLGSPRKAPKEGSFPCLLSHHTILTLAKKYKKTPAHILLRFLTQEGLTVIPNSTNPDRLRENFQIFDFELQEVDMAEVRRLDKGVNGRKFCMDNFKGFEDHPEFPFKTAEENATPLTQPK